MEALRKPLTTDLKALLLWCQGVTLSDQQKYPQAADAYQKALQADPAFTPAASALEELRVLKLVSRPPDTLEVLERLRQKVSVSDRPEPDDLLKRERSGGEVPTSDVNVRWR
jgi:tetratricopeptide (TPR) repeat protein